MDNQERLEYEKMYGKKVSRKKVATLRKKVKTHNFSSNRYKIVWRKPTKQMAGGDAWGLCDDNAAPEKTIHISPSLNEYDFLTVCLDEAIHACNFSLDNDHVGEMSTSIGNFLWRLGFRLQEIEEHE